MEDLRPHLDKLNDKQKDKLLYQLLNKDKTLIEQLYFKHLSTSAVLDERYNNFEIELKQVLFAPYRTKIDELALAKAIGEAKKVVNRFTKVDKRPHKEAELITTILDAVLIDPHNPAKLGTCWTEYDFAVC